MRVSTVSGEARYRETTLVGRLRDQAELNGVLETLYGLHLPILSVQLDDTGEELL